LVDHEPDGLEHGSAIGLLRAQTLALTATGRKLVPVLSALADAYDEEFYGHLDPATRATIEATVKQIVRRQGPRAAPVE
jgi:DNA-binding MarR family transcriptional regulator